jgi:hypothetical protein
VYVDHLCDIEILACIAFLAIPSRHLCAKWVMRIHSTR